MAFALDANEESDGCSLCARNLGGDGGEVDGERYEMCFVGEMGAIAAIVFVKPRDDGIGIGGDVLIDGCFLALEPITDECLVEGFLGALMSSDIEIGIAEGGAVEAGLYPVVVHAESTENDFSVVATEIVVEGFDFSCS